MTIIILLLASFCAAAISGAAGFGGALLLLPLLVVTRGVAEAVPLLTVAQIVGNLSRLVFGFHQIQWKPVALFLAGGLPFSVLGAQTFFELPKDLVIRCVGGGIFLFAVLKIFSIPHLSLRTGTALLIVGGGVVGFLSGLVGSAGPLGATIFLSLGLPPVAYIATEATTSLALHTVKIFVYQQYLPLDEEFWFLASLMGIAMVLGTWSAKGIIERIPAEKFQRYVAGLLMVIGVYMLVHG